MADPTSILTFQDLIIDAAQYAGIADISDSTKGPQIPTNGQDLALIKSLVNRGYQKFVRESEWEFLQGTATINFVTQYTGSVTTAGVGTFIDSARTETTNDIFKGFKMKVTKSDTSTFETVVESYDGSTKTFTFGDSSLVFTASDTYDLAGPTTTNGENFRYLMPDDFVGELRGDVTYTQQSNGAFLTLLQVSDSEIRTMYSASDGSTGTPNMVAFVPLDMQHNKQGPRWEMKLWPEPSLNATIEVRYRKHPQLLSDLNDRPITGPQHDTTLMAAVRSEVERQRFDKIGIEQSNYERELAISLKRDSSSRATNLGDYGDKGGRLAGLSFPGRRLGTVDTFDNITLS